MTEEEIEAYADLEKDDDEHLLTNGREAIGRLVEALRIALKERDEAIREKETAEEYWMDLETDLEKLHDLRDAVVAYLDANSAYSKRSRNKFNILEAKMVLDSKVKLNFSIKETESENLKGDIKQIRESREG